MISIVINFETKESILKSFDDIAETLTQKVNLKINNSFYRIVDFEFYTFSENLQDPYTYKNNLQLQNCKLYLHGSGIDITLGDGINYGGVLLRSIIKLYGDSEPEQGFMKQQFIGPQIVATEIISNLNPLNSFVNNEISIIDVKTLNNNFKFYPAKKVVKTKRVGLTHIPTDKDGFFKNLPIRYIAILPRFPKFKYIIKGIESIITENVLNGEILINEAREILGYKKDF